MPANVASVLDNHESKFWDQFEGLVPEAVRCRFFSTAMAIANGRAREYSRESGPLFLPPVETTHLPNAIKRLNLLKVELEILTTFFPEDNPSVRHTDRKRGGQVISEASGIVADFEQKIVVPLNDVVKNRDEARAKETIESSRGIAKQIALSSEVIFNRTTHELEGAVAQSIVFRKSLNGFVSCVSVDLAQYGAHAKVLHDYAGAPAILELNRRISREINSSIDGLDIPPDDVLIIDTGDGAILIFTNSSSDSSAVVADRAYRFADAFLKLVAKDNEGKDIDNQLHFRVGICSGIIAGEHCQIRQSDVGRCRAGGVPIGTAVRLQSAARTGEIIACATTWDRLPEDGRGRFKSQEQVWGKLHEKTPILAHRFACVPPRAEEAIA